MSLLRESPIYLVASVGVSAGGFLLIPILTRVLTPAKYGILGAAGVVGGLLTIVMPLGLHGSVTCFYYDYREDRDALKHYVSTIMVPLASVEALCFVSSARRRLAVLPVRPVGGDNGVLQHVGGDDRLLMPGMLHYASALLGRPLASVAS